MNILSVDKKIVKEADKLWNQFDAALSPKHMSMAQAQIHNETKVANLISTLVKHSTIGLTERDYQIKIGHISSPWLRFVALVELSHQTVI